MTPGAPWMAVFGVMLSAVTAACGAPSHPSADIGDDCAAHACLAVQACPAPSDAGPLRPFDLPEGPCMTVDVCQVVTETPCLEAGADGGTMTSQWACTCDVAWSCSVITAECK